MGQPKKIAVEQTANGTASEKPKIFTVEGLMSQWGPVVKDYSSRMGNQSTFFAYDPYVQNARLKMLKTNPTFPDRSELEDAIKAPGTSEYLLRATSWALTANSYPYYKMLRLYSDVLLYNHYVYPKYVEKKELTTPRFKNEQKFINKWVDSFDPKRTFRRIVAETLIEGKRAYVYQQKLDYKNADVTYAALQELPSNWWKPTFKSTDSYFGVSFNFAYFWSPGTSPKQFPPIFQKYYDELLGMSTVTRDKVKLDMDKISHSSFDVEFTANKWYIWAELPASDVWCFSADESHAWQVPPFLGLFLSFQDLGSYQFLQTQLASIPLYGILSGEVPMHTDTKTTSSQTPDDLRLSPGMLGMLTDQAHSMTPSGVGAFLAPVENIKFHQFQEQVNSSKIYTEALQQTIATSGLTGLQSTSEKPTVAMVKASQLVEKRFADIFYPQFIKFVHTIFEKKLTLKYEWRFDIFGDVFSEQNAIDTLSKQLAQGQSYLLPKLLAYHNLDMDGVNGISDWVNSSDIFDKMKVPPNANTQAAKENASAGIGPNVAKEKKPVGHPALDEADIENDSTAANSDSGTNKGEDRQFTVSDIDDDDAEAIVELLLGAGYEIES
jgi:hypothetical protein